MSPPAGRLPRRRTAQEWGWGGGRRAKVTVQPGRLSGGRWAGATSSARDSRNLGRGAEGAGSGRLQPRPCCGRGSGSGARGPARRSTASQPDTSEGAGPRSAHVGRGAGQAGPGAGRGSGAAGRRRPRRRAWLSGEPLWPSPAAASTSGLRLRPAVPVLLPRSALLCPCSSSRAGAPGRGGARVSLLRSPAGAEGRVPGPPLRANCHGASRPEAGLLVEERPLGNARGPARRGRSGKS